MSGEQVTQIRLASVFGLGALNGVNIDRDNLRLNGVVGALAGVEALGHRSETDLKTIDMLAVLGLEAGARGIATRFGHTGLSENGVGRKVAMSHEFRREGEALVVDLHLMDSARRSPAFAQDPIDYILDMAENQPRELAMSGVVSLYEVWVLNDGRELPTHKRGDWPQDVAVGSGGRPIEATTKYPIIRPVKFHRLDIVNDGAITSGLFNTERFQQMFLSGDSQYAEQAFMFLDQLREHGISPVDLQGKVEQILQKYLYKLSLHGGVQMDEKEKVETPSEAATSKVANEDGRVLAKLDKLGDGFAQMNGSFEKLAGVMEKGFESLFVLPPADDGPVVEGMGIAPVKPVIGLGKDEAGHQQDIVDWMFGVPDAPLPEPRMRTPRDVYFAFSGDYDWHGRFKRSSFSNANTSLLPDLAVNAMNKVVIAQMARMQDWRWYEPLVKVEPNDGTLHAMQWITYGGVANLQTVTEGGTYTELTLGDARETDAFLKMGNFIAITMEMYRNSEIGKIQMVPLAMATACVRTRSATFAEIFSSNSGVGPTLDDDATALFHSNHNNVATTAIGSDTTAWKAASQECFDHTELGSGKAIAVRPRYFLGPNELHYTALENFGYGQGWPTSYAYHTDPAQEHNVNDPRPVPVTVPDWPDPNNWAYLADPAIWPVIHVSFAQSTGGGQWPAPELFVAGDARNGLMFTNDAMPIKARDHYAAGVNGAKGIGKRNVA